MISKFYSFLEARELASDYDCKIIETSGGFQHNVDQLLVGILKQMQLKAQMPNEPISSNPKQSGRRFSFIKSSSKKRDSVDLAKDFLRKLHILKKCNSCDDLLSV